MLWFKVLICGHSRSCVLTRSLILRKIMDKCNWCNHNCGCVGPKNLDVVAEIAVTNYFLKPWFDWYFPTDKIVWSIFLDVVYYIQDVTILGGCCNDLTFCCCTLHDDRDCGCLVFLFIGLSEFSRWMTVWFIDGYII